MRQEAETEPVCACFSKVAQEERHLRVQELDESLPSEAEGVEKLSH